MGFAASHCLAYSAYPILRPQAYGIPCHPLPTAHTGDEVLPVDVPETIHGNILLSADDLEACDWPSDQLNVFERFRWMSMAEQIDHSVFVFHGDFHVPEAAALGAVQKSTILLREKRPAEAFGCGKEGRRFAARQFAGADSTGRCPDGIS